jgi:hypothetical protein
VKSPLRLIARTFVEARPAGCVVGLIKLRTGFPP